MSIQLQCYHHDDCHSLYVAVDDAGAIVGQVAVHWVAFLFLNRPEAYISGLFVGATERGKGIGSCLPKTIMAEAQDRGCSGLTLINLRHRESWERRFCARRG